MSHGYTYFCHTCTWPFEERPTESDAWADGVEHYNTYQHEGGEVRYFDGRDFENTEIHDQEGHQHHHHHHEHGHHDHAHREHHEEPHIF